MAYRSPSAIAGYSMEWHTDSLQAAAFNVPGLPQPEALKLWQALTGSSPDNFQRPSGAPNAVTIASGRLGSRQMQITSQIGRVDLQITGVDTGPENPSYLSDWEASADFLGEAYIKSISEIKVYRVGIIGMLSCVVPEADLVGEMRKTVGKANFPAGSTDLIFQYNKPIVSKDSGIKFNRVLTFSTGQQQLFSIAGFVPGAAAQLRVDHTINLRVDVNTSTGFQQDLTPRLAALIPEMIAELKRILSAKELFQQ